jgi:hypothetical protein
LGLKEFELVNELFMLLLALAFKYSADLSKEEIFFDLKSFESIVVFIAGFISVFD